MKKICIFAVLAVLTLGLSGCEEDWYRPGFIGEWDLIEAGGFPVDSRYADTTTARVSTILLMITGITVKNGSDGMPTNIRYI